MKKQNIVLYSMPECPPCLALKSFLKKHGVIFQDFDVEFNLENRAKLKEISGSGKVPYIIIDGESTLGFDEAKMRQLLKIK